MDSGRRVSAHGSPGEDPGQLNRLHARLLARLDTLAPALIALSGGLDSRLLCTLAAQSSQGAGGFAAVHVTGPHVPRQDSERARDCCQRLGLRLVELEFDPVSIDAVRSNSPERCYHCKTAIFSRLGELAEQQGFVHVLDGSNASDKSEHRPGLRALRELGVLSPLAEVGLHKGQLRLLARGLGLPQWNQPARPCLLTRLSYGLSADTDLLNLLNLLDRGEEMLQRGGFQDFRLRVPQRGRFVLQLAESELDLWELQAEGALDALAQLGLEPVEIVPSRQVSGWYDHDSQKPD